MRLTHVVLIATLGSIPSPASAQPTSGGADIYAKTADSVVLIESRDSAGQPVGQASAFVIAPGQLLTNAHAVIAASVWLKIGPAAIPANVERVDSLNDLALLRVGIELAIKPLQFAQTQPASGSRVFALGNPRGLERTITEGLITGLRTVDNQSLLQISAAISPGSSGGPVLDERGDVVGVAVGSIQSAQNLNFAVPATIARAFALNESPTSKTTGGSPAVEALIRQRDGLDWSDEPESLYQQVTRKLRDAVVATAASIQSEQQLLDLFDKVKLLETSIERPVATRATVVAPRSSEAQYNLAWSLQQEAFGETDLAKRRVLLLQAEAAGTKALEFSSPAGRRLRLLLLGQVQTEIDTKHEVALANLRQAIGTAKDETAREAALSLYSYNLGAEQLKEARRWFQFAESIGNVSTFYYAEYAQLLERMDERTAAADAYVKAATLEYKRLCDAARVLVGTVEVDAAIDRARDCLNRATTAAKGDDTAAWAHRLLAVLLEGRGVIDQAILHARQAIAIKSDDGLSFGILAEALNRAERYSEAETAARSAIRLSDGAYSSDHFQLGSALFELQRWSEAKSAFEQAAKMDSEDSAATYNIALCLIRLGFKNDAVYWYEETLRRNPNIDNAAQIRKRLVELRP